MEKSFTSNYIILSVIFALMLVGAYLVGTNAADFDTVLESSLWLQLIFGIIAYGNLVLLGFPAFVATLLFTTNVLNIYDDDDSDSNAFIVIAFWLAGSMFLIWPVFALLGSIFYLAKNNG